MCTKNILVVVLLNLLSLNSARAQQVKVGANLPSFEATDTNGNFIHSDSLRGKKILLAFFRYVGCPVCHFRVNELVENYDSIQAMGYTILAIYESDNVTLSAYLSEYPLPFHVIGDPHLELYKKLGIEKSGWRMLTSLFSRQTLTARKRGSKLFKNKIRRYGSLSRLPADFLIDENGIIIKVHYGTHIADHMPLSEIFNSR
jgi:thioredoxin-dependent peroxiredoxin